MKEFFGSKKVKGFLLGVLALFLVEVLEMDPDLTKGVIALTVSFLGAQGIADFGKEKAKVEKAAVDN